MVKKHGNPNEMVLNKDRDGVLNRWLGLHAKKPMKLWGFWMMVMVKYPRNAHFKQCLTIVEMNVEIHLGFRMYSTALGGFPTLSPLAK